MRFTLVILLSIFISTTVVMGQAAKVTRSSQTISSNGQTYYMHKIVRGQTLEQIAAAYNVSEESILAKNPFAAKELIPRQVILIPNEKQREKLIPKKAIDDTIVTAPITPKVDTVATITEVMRTWRTRDFNTNEPINIAVILPFTEQNSSTNGNFADFYRGVLIALNELKERGTSTNVEVVSCGVAHDELAAEESAERIINSGVLDNANLIIGPVYQNAFIPVAHYATKNRIPIISPLSAVEGIESPFVFQVSPNEDTKFAKLNKVLQNPMANIIAFKHESYTDEAMMKYLNDNSIDFKVIEKAADVVPQSISSMLDNSKDNILIVPINNEMAVSTLLQKISAVNSTSKYKITVVGLPRWSRFNNISVETLFALNTFYVSNYHEDRSSDVMVQYYADYIKSFGALPSLFSMRGYDVTLMFVAALAKWGAEMPLYIDNYSPELLQVKYNFKQVSDTSNFINQEWMLVNYTPNNEIIVE